jgi:hypothetical protein
MDDDGFTPPSRQRFRDERRAQRSADRRRKLLALPIVAAGIALVAAGVFVFMGDGAGQVPTEVRGTSIVRSTTTAPPTTLPAAETESATDVGG